MRKLLRQLLSFLLRPGQGKQNQWVVVLAVFTLTLSLWLSVTLNQEYTATLVYPVAVTGFPKSIFVSDIPNPQVSITARGNGLELLGESFRFKRDTLELQFDEHENNLSEGYIYLPGYNNQFARELGAGVEVIRISPERLYFSYENKVSRKVPLVLTAKLNLATAYHLVEKPQLRPDSVTLTGLPGTLDTIMQWVTYNTTTELINRQQTLRLKVLDTMEAISVSPDEVSLQVRPQRYREVQLKVPVLLVAVPDTIDTVRLSSPFMRFTCLVPEPDFEVYMREMKDLEIVIPYNTLNPDWPYLIPAPELPAAVQLIYRDPDELTFVIVSK